MKTSPRSLYLHVALAVGLLAGSQAANAQALNYQNYNAIIFNDLNTTSDIEGRTFVGHDFTGTNSANLGNHLSNSVPANDRSFVVGNNLFGGNSINMQRGSLYIDGSTNGRGINYNGGGSTVVDHTIDSSTATIKAYSIAQSQALAALTPDSYATFPTTTPGPTLFHTVNDGDGVAVFNVSAANIFNNPYGQQFDIVWDGFTSDIVINVSGTTVNWQNGNMVGLFNDNKWQSHTIWNFYEATSITLQNNFKGAILAPLASITAHSNIDGLVVANNLTTQHEVHLPNDGNAYDGYTAAAPEPGSALLILALGGVVLVARNRRLLI